MTTITKENLPAGLFGRGPKQSLDDFFSVAANPKMGTETKMPIEKLHPSPRNPFIVEHDEAMEELIASIKAKGILVPLIIRPTENGKHEIIAGHRRFHAAQEAGLTEAPCIIKGMTDEEADIIMVDTNLNRPHIRTSEKAFAYKLKYEAIKRTAGRKKMSEPGSDKKNDISGMSEPGSDKTENGSGMSEPGSDKTENGSGMSEPGSDKYDSAVEIAKEMGVSDKTIKNYLRLTKLHRSLLELVDKKDLPLKAGVQLSYLTELTQGYIYYWMEKEGIKVDLELASTLRREFEEKPDALVFMDNVLKVMRPQKKEKKTQQKGLAVKLDKAMKKEYFPEGYDNQAIEEVIRQLLDQWARSNNPEYKTAKKTGSQTKAAGQRMPDHRHGGIDGCIKEESRT